SRSAADRTRVRVSSRSWPRPLSAFDTVPTLTPAACATSQMVAGSLRARERICEVLIGGERSTNAGGGATENVFFQDFSPIRPHGHGLGRHPDMEELPIVPPAHSRAFGDPRQRAGSHELDP